MKAHRAAVGHVASPPHALLQRILPESEALPVPSVTSLLRLWRPPSPALLNRVARRPWEVRPDVALTTLLPRGKVDITDRARGLHALVGEPQEYRTRFDPDDGSVIDW